MRADLVYDTMGVSNKITFGAAVEVGLGWYNAAKADAWALGSTTNSILAVLLQLLREVSCSAWPSCCGGR